MPSTRTKTLEHTWHGLDIDYECAAEGHERRANGSPRSRSVIAAKRGSSDRVRSRGRSTSNCAHADDAMIASTAVTAPAHGTLATTCIHVYRFLQPKAPRAPCQFSSQCLAWPPYELPQPSMPRTPRIDIDLMPFFLRDASHAHMQTNKYHFPYA